MKTRIVQVKNPETDKYIKIDRVKGKILERKKTYGPYKGIPIVSRKSHGDKEFEDTMKLILGVGLGLAILGAIHK